MQMHANILLLTFSCTFLPFYICVPILDVVFLPAIITILVGQTPVHTVE
jgi:hypothetical protein